LLATATENAATTFVVLFFAEALAWAGVPAIGAAAMATAGVLASQGTVHLWAVVVVGTAGSWVGGLAGWQIGHRTAWAGLQREEPGRFAARREKALDTGERFEKRWGRLMVFFVPSWVSGALGMPFGQFARWNVLAALLWVMCAGLGAYGIGSAASGNGLLHSLLPILIAAGAAAALILLYVRWRRRRDSTALTAAMAGQTAAARDAAEAGAAPGGA
jgi:membrane protein DedA with SNARE-associated domain